MTHTLEDVKAAVKAAVERHPNRRNPTEPGTTKCINTGVKGTHCIAAQVVVDLGHPMTKYGHVGNNHDLEATLGDLDLLGNFTADAIEYLCEAQGVFDEGQVQRKWSTCYRSLAKVGVNGPED